MKLAVLVAVLLVGAWLLLYLSSTGVLVFQEKAPAPNPIAGETLIVQALTEDKAISIAKYSLVFPIESKPKTMLRCVYFNGIGVMERTHWYSPNGRSTCPRLISFGE